MDIPQMEKMSKEDIIGYMRNCAKQYVPEWRYDKEQPDAGTALVSIFADLMYDNIKKFNMSAAGDLLSFFDGVNARLYPASPAEGFVVFALPEGYLGEAEVPRQTRLLAQGTEGQLVFETQEEVLVKTMELTHIFLAKPKEDTIYELYSRKRDPAPSFFLFQNKEENLQQHLLYFCFGRELEIKSYADARLSFVPEGRSAETKGLREAFLNPERIRFYYGTGEEFCGIAELAYENGTLCFHIPGGERGIAPMEEYGGMYVISAEVRDAEYFSGIYFREASLCTDCLGQRPEFINVNGTEQEIEEFLAFGENPSVYDEFYIGNGEIFGKAGAHISVEFDLDFVRIPIEEAAAGMKISWKRIMRKKEFVPEQEYDITIREVIWEYYNGYGWKRLSISGQYGDIFTVEEGMQGVRRKIEFTCPADVERALVSSSENYCIRARIIRMNNAYKTRGAYIAPVAGNFSLSYSYQENPLRPRLMFRQNNMELKVHGAAEMQRAGFAFPACEARPEEEKTCYFGFAQPPVGGPLKLLFVMHDTVRGNLVGLRWEYLSKEGWKEMHPADGTEGFAHTGLISWYGRDDSCQKTLFGQDLYWIRLSEGKGEGSASGGLKRDGQGRGKEEWNRKNPWDGENKGNDRNNCPKIEGIYPNATSILGVETVEETFELSPRAEKKEVWLAYQNICSLEVRVLGRMDYQHSLEQSWELWKEVEELSVESGRRNEFAADWRTGRIIFPKYMETAGRNQGEAIEIHVRYRHSQGDQGNVQAGGIERLDRTIGFINTVFNPMATVCGLSEETVLKSVARHASLLRHGRRCVSAEDYEDMAREAARDICKVKCFAGYDENGRRQEGAVTLVVLPGDYGESAYSFERTRRRIYHYLSDHMDQNIVRLGRFYIVMPDLIRLDVKVVIELSQEGGVFEATKRVRQELDRFLDALHGNFYGEGWEIGILPDQNQIIHALKQVEGVKYISHLSLRKYKSGRFTEYEVNEERLLPFYRLPKSGFHEVAVEFQ